MAEADVQKRIRRFLESFVVSRQGKIDSGKSTVSIELPQLVARQLNCDRALRIAIGADDNIESWEDYPTLRKLITAEVSDLPKVFRVVYRSTDPKEQVVSFFNNAAKGLAIKSSALEYVESEVLRAAFKVIFQGEGLVEIIRIGIAIQEPRLCRIDRKPLEINASLLRPLQKSQLMAASIQDALLAIFRELTDDVYPQYDAMKNNLWEELLVEKERVEDFYKDLNLTNAETQGLEPASGSPRDRLEREKARVLANLNERFKLSVKFTPVSLCLLTTSFHTVRRDGLTLAKLPFSNRLFSSGCALCRRAVDGYSLVNSHLYCEICRPD